MDRIALAYALLGHYKEKCNDASKSIWVIYLPIVKKAFYNFFTEEDVTEIRGRAITELQQKIFDIFEINFPIPILRDCLLQLKEEINDTSKFELYTDNAFDIKASAITSVEDLIKESEQELNILEDDFHTFCQTRGVECEFNMLLEFINTMQIEIFADETVNIQNVNSIIPLYVNIRKNNKEIFRIISNIYTGSLLSSYLSHKIKTPVAKVELLIDTNFFISLIDLNTEDAHTTCKDLYHYCKDMGFHMTILPSTVEQIKILLTNRIKDFAYKNYLGTIKTADIYNACIRRKIDQTQLERIRNKVEETLQDYEIDILKEGQIAQVVERARKSEVYKKLKETRGNKESALNDAIAIEYVASKRGTNSTNFSDIKCWFLHNSYGNFYRDPGANVVKRTSIGAPELLTMLWMANPAQVNSMKLSRVGLTAYVTKYLEQRLPSDNTLKAIQQRAQQAQEVGEITEKDFYNLCTRMSEGSLTQEEINNLEQIPQEEFSIYIAQMIVAQNELIAKAEQAIQDYKERMAKIKRIKDLRQEKEGIIQEINKSKESLAPLQKEREESFWNWEPIALWLAVILCLTIIFILFYYRDNICKEDVKWLYNGLITIFSLGIPVLGILIKMYSDNIEKRKDKAYKKWENNPKHSEYRKLQEKVKELESHLKNVEEQLSQSINDVSDNIE